MDYGWNTQYSIFSYFTSDKSRIVIMGMRVPGFSVLGETNVCSL